MTMRVREEGETSGADAATDEMYLSVLRDRFGDRLSPEEWGNVKGALAEQREKAAKLRSVSLSNGDEPATTFRVGHSHG